MSGCIKDYDGSKYLILVLSNKNKKDLLKNMKNFGMKLSFILKWIITVQIIKMIKFSKFKLTLLKIYL